MAKHLVVEVHTDGVVVGVTITDTRGLNIEIKIGVNMDLFCYTDMVLFVSLSFYHYAQYCFGHLAVILIIIYILVHSLDGLQCCCKIRYILHK